MGALKGMFFSVLLQKRTAEMFKKTHLCYDIHIEEEKYHEILRMKKK